MTTELVDEPIDGHVYQKCQEDRILRRWHSHVGLTLNGQPSNAMDTQNQDIYWLQRALELARRGIALTSPDPAVGCVILDCADQVVGEGWHEYDLLDHAEIIALNEAAQ